MVTLGIDLASEPKRTAGCEIEWTGGGARVRWISSGLADDEIIQRAKAADAVGIDAPFGWPRYFVEAITAHHTGRPWPVAKWEDVARRKLRLRATDQRVHEETGLTPLSVSSDTIAIPAARCALLIDRLGVRDRSGDGRVYEVYPAAALRLWGCRHNRYKEKKNLTSLGELVSDLREKTPWLEIPQEFIASLGASDHAFDALVASLVTRAARLGLTLKPRDHELADAKVEGWIAVPFQDSLGRLPEGRQSRVGRGAIRRR